MKKEQIAEQFKGLQDTICSALETADGGAQFQEDPWERPGGGGGRTRTIGGGHVIEKGGVGFSAVHGETPEKILKALQLEPSDFFATGVSLVIHPESPMVPISHANLRYFEMDNGISWFGGGIDLTPIYVDVEEAAWFHEELKKTCDRHDSSFYPSYKAWCDDYFYIKHRNETRGIGGIFFDHLRPNENGKSQEDLFAFILDVGETYARIYPEIMHNKRDLPFGKAEKEWQNIRRGRYVEFNLVLDKGTKFGLDTNGRTESILMSMPPHAGWVYNHQPPAGSREAETLEYLKKGINWQELIHA